MKNKTKSKEELEPEWDANLTEFWDATLNSFTKCHAEKDVYADPEQVTDDLLEEMSVRRKAAIHGSTSSKVNNRPVDIAPGTISKKEDKEDVDEEAVGKNIEDESEEEQYAHELYEEAGAEAECEQDAQSKDNSYSASKQRGSHKRKAAQTSTIDQLSPLESGQASGKQKRGRGAKKAKKADGEDEEQYQEEQFPESHDYQYSYQQPAYDDQTQQPWNASFVPTPPSMPSQGEDDDLSNLIMAWYYAGYYTAAYQAKRRS